MMTLSIVSVMFVSFLATALLTKIFIPILHRMKFGQQVRDEGPDSHLKKQGTPTMGGIVILSTFTLCSLVFLGENASHAVPIYILTIGFGLVGFLDDYIKIVKKRSLGLRARQKLFLQFLITGIFYFYLVNYMEGVTSVIIPFTNGYVWNMGLLFLPFTFIGVLGTVNGANFTDGLDGLASSVTVIIIAFFAIFSLLYGVGSFESYSVFSTSGVMIGVILGFLLFNIHPAKLFMGDTGSLALGGFVAAIAFMLKAPLFILIVGFIYLAEILSVIIQVGYFKITKGKRIFKMAPIHHHFELCGMEETRVVYLFVVITFFLGMLGFYAFAM